MSSTRARRAGRPRTPISRESLLDAAAGVFAAQGYAGASLQEIAQAAGLRKASLFHHFESKEALYLEAVASAVGALGGLIAEAQLDGGGYVERLDRLSVLVTRSLGARPRVARLLMREMIDEGPFLQGPGALLVPQVLGGARAFLEAGMAAGAFTPQPSDQLVMSILGLHLTWFAGLDLTRRISGADPFEAEALEARAQEVAAQVRRLCGCEALRRTGPAAQRGPAPG
ncbi:MAG: TetR/AcrR family transcriptional regulator [Alphaproteobacteria bacterium]|nr:TetR/AcrR family transcriptional regulator [Alphaproteobacteria bacterium]MCB9792724.1 TetR/AcrR family transcriptional regulator [Alphaproteobacteria bacterium]